MMLVFLPKIIYQTYIFRVYTSASGRIVWALDNEQNVYVREGIFPDFRQGVDWLLGDCF